MYVFVYVTKLKSNKVYVEDIILRGEEVDRERGKGDRIYANNLLIPHVLFKHVYNNI